MLELRTADDAAAPLPCPRTSDMTRYRFAAAFALLAAVAGGLDAEAGPEKTIYLELWRPAPEASGQEEGARPIPGEVAEAPALLVAVGRPTAAASIAGWCEQLRRQDPPSVLPDVLLRDGEYGRFATESVPLLVEILVDDVELRYALGTERPRGATGLEFPFFELCPLGFGRRAGPEWAVDVVHLANHRGEHVALGLYKGALPATERASLEAQFGYPSALPDPAGVVILGKGKEVEVLLLRESADAGAFDELRAAIVR
ncbi:MAG: hypothetical protein OEP45_12530 [Acidobacteriota bacterium]|nr:hypothetical protein [Acidobacteriota bacterium]